MRIFAVYSYTRDGERHLLWVRQLPADFDWQAWANQRRDAAKILGVSRFAVEVFE